MKVGIVRPAELSTSDLSTWDAIQDSSPIYRSPFYSHQFTQAVGQTRSDARVAILEVDGSVAGFLPFHLMRGRVAKPIGGPISDYQGPILSPDAEISPTQLLEGAGLAAYDYNHLPVAMRAFTSAAYDFSVSPHMDMTEGYDVFLSSRTASWSKAQREIRRRQKKMVAEHGEMELNFHDPSDEAYLQHVQMKNLSYSKLGVRSMLDSGWVAETLDIIRKTQDREFAGMMTTLRAGGRLVAAHFGMRRKNVWHYWFPSYDPDLSRLGPGIAMLNEASSRSAEVGISVIDFGRGNLEYKQLFSNAQTELCEGSFSRSGTAAGLLRGGQRLVLTAVRPVPLGRYESYPRRALARLVSGVTLPDQ